MTRPQFRDHIAASMSWVVAGLCWAAQLLLPWTTVGALSASSQVDGFQLVRSGSVSSVAPTWTAYTVLLLPVIGLAVVALSGVAGRRASAARLGAAGLGIVVVGVAVHGLVEWDLPRLGPGGWTAAVGGALAVLGCSLDRLEHLRALAPTPTTEVVP